ncbi:MAG: NADH-quinone oxidoreductase subunit J [Bacteroidia bacterium]|nr:NADH-quinone oxidoreductase subunit J [Bacteroidia bacterium]MDW8333023.1 NADH-quinone oxidoreductase subunit J [Bacteroidia bacterium]
MSVAETILFGVLAVGALIGGIGLITNRNPLYCVLYVILNFFCIGGLYLTLMAEFLAVIQIIVYAGAIMVLFLFVVMLLNLTEKEAEPITWDWRRLLAYVLGLGFLGEMLYAFSRILDFKPAPEKFDYGKAEAVGKLMMTGYVFPFEMISIVLLAAVIGAVAIAKKYKKPRGLSV